MTLLIVFGILIFIIYVVIYLVYLAVTSTLSDKRAFGTYKDFMYMVTGKNFILENNQDYLRLVGDDSTRICSLDYCFFGITMVVDPISFLRIEWYLHKELKIRKKAKEKIVPPWHVKK